MARNCPLLQIEYDNELNSIYRCASVHPHTLECKIYSDEEKKR